MSDTLLNRRDLDFQLYEALDTESLCERERFVEHSRETFSAVIDTADKIARERFAPHNSVADKEEPRIEDGKVTMRSEVKTAIDALCRGGLYRRAL